MAELKYWIWLNELGLNPFQAKQLLDHFGSPQNIYFTDTSDIKQLQGLSRNDMMALSNKSLDRVYRIEDDMLAIKGRIITQQDAEYPARLRNIPDPPVVLYVRGRLPAVDDEAVVAMAGTRNDTPYGQFATAKIAAEIIRHGGVVASGLARGIDTAAAKGALHEGGPVIGVLGCGVERVYPTENAPLFEDVLQNGALISEYPPGTEPKGIHFPRRNRIITGLSIALVVAEIPTSKSGAMISVNHAIEQGREVFAIPANIDARTSAGTNALIADEGIRAVLSGFGVLRDYIGQYPRIKTPEDLAEAEQAKKTIHRPSFQPIRPVKTGPPTPRKPVDTSPPVISVDITAKSQGRTAEEQAILAHLSNEPLHVDELIQKTGFPAPKVSVALITLGIDDYVKEHPGKRYSFGDKIYDQRSK